MAKQAQSLIDRLDQKVFDVIYSRSLVYNTCREDPAIDRLALALRPQDPMLVIASAGCNVLDYALTMIPDRRAGVPYLPGLRVPYYLYVGRKPAT